MLNKIHLFRYYVNKNEVLLQMYEEIYLVEVNSFDTVFYGFLRKHYMIHTLILYFCGFFDFEDNRILYYELFKVYSFKFN